MLLVISYVQFYSVPNVAEIQQAAPAETALFVMLDRFEIFLLFGFLGTLFNILVILNIKAITEGHYQHFFQHTFQASKALLSVVILYIIISLPFSLGIALISDLLNSSTIGLLVLIFGVYFFVRLSLVVYMYLLETSQNGIGQTLKLSWQLSHNRFKPIFLFCLIVYFLFGLLEMWLGGYVDNILVISPVVKAAINYFIIVFSFRFYQVYRQQGVK